MDDPNAGPGPSASGDSSEAGITAGAADGFAADPSDADPSHADPSHADPSHSDPSHAADGLTLLGRRVTEPVDHLECFAAPPGCSRVTLTSDEVTSLCPVTGQPDFSTVAIDYEPAGWCVESKSLKLYLMRFRNRPVFAEALATEIAREVTRAAAPLAGAVTVTQRPRGGITIQAVAALPAA